MSELSRWNKFIDTILPNNNPYDFSNKSNALNNYVSQYLNRTARMFEYKNLPDTIRERELELMLQINGNVAWYKHEGNLYVFTGGLGGEPNAYYMPTIYTINNPFLKLSVMAEIGKNCVVMPSDTNYCGLMPLINRYATAMVENDLSMVICSINSRLTSVISAQDDRTRESAKEYLQHIIDGEIGVIGESAFLESLKVQPYAQTGTNQLKNLIEYEQYLKASLYNELGLNANYNMKREALNSGESALNDDMLLPLCDDMLNCRKLALEKVNAMFDTKISVDFASSWKQNIEEIENALNEEETEEPKEGENTDDEEPKDS